MNKKFNKVELLSLHTAHVCSMQKKPIVSNFCMLSVKQKKLEETMY